MRVDDVTDNIRHCLKCADRIDNGDVDLDSNDAMAAMAGYGLRSLADTLRPAIPALIVVKETLRKVKQGQPG